MTSSTAPAVPDGPAAPAAVAPTSPAAPPVPTDPAGAAAPVVAKPPRGFVTALIVAAVGAGAAQMSAALLTLTLKANALDASTATTTISLSSGIAGILTLVALPVIGALSDRSRSRLGRRRPYLIGGAASFSLGGLLLVAAPNVPLFIAAHLLITLGFVAAGVTTTALIADQLPKDRRGPSTAFLSLATPIGALLGTLVSIPFGDSLLPLVGIPTVLAVAGMLALAAMMRDPQVDVPRGRLHLRELIGVFWVNPVRHPDFAAVFASRMLVFSGVAALNGYQAIYLLRKIGMEPAGLGTAITVTVVVNAGVSLLVAPAIGRLSDRIGVRKPFICAAAVILGAGLVLASLAGSFPTYLLACGVVALGQGVYFAVELAFAMRVLPDPDNPAKDLAIVKVADNLPVSIVSALAPALLAIGAATGEQNFASLFLAGAISAVLGGLVILVVRGAR